MTRHLKTCLEARAAAASGKKSAHTTPAFLLTVSGKYAPEYWLHLQARADATLADLDSFLRRIWLECCGHMSEFKFARKKRPLPLLMGAMDWLPMDWLPMEEEQSMDEPLKEVLTPGMEFEHEYDFGSTTHLALKVAGEFSVPDNSASIMLLARNDPPQIACDVCGKPAKVICTECSYDTGGWLCAKCAKKHDCDEDMQLPVVNSPRVGVCGYTGEEL